MIVLPERLDNETVKMLRKLEKSQSDEWKKLFLAMTDQQFVDYSSIKTNQQREDTKIKRAKWTFNDWLEFTFTMNNYIASVGDGIVEELDLIDKIEQRLLGLSEETFTFFWETESPFSQWHPAKFVAPSFMWPTSAFYAELQKEGFPAQYAFSSSEQYMMYAKAMTFVDLEAAKAIMEETNPRKIKALGRSVKRFDENTWEFYRYRFVYLANYYKFSQNEHLKHALLATKGTTIVEASPYDKIWGIGLTKDDPKAQKRTTWEGKNLLGEILTELRLEFERTTVGL